MSRFKRGIVSFLQKRWPAILLDETGRAMTPSEKVDLS
jgi:hypothetical protein